MFEMKASEKTNELNAYVTGFGASKRVVVWDTTMSDMTMPQTLFVFGHEMGHYVLGHLVKGFLITIVLLLVFFYLAYRIANWLMRRQGKRWGIRGLGDFASAPMLLLILYVLSFVSEPISNAISRHFEHQADQYGLEVIHGLVPTQGGPPQSHSRSWVSARSIIRTSASSRRSGCGPIPQSPIA